MTSKISSGRKNSEVLDVDESLKDIVDSLAESYLQQGYPLLAACTHLSINDPASAAMKLIRANEISFAFALCKLFKLSLINYVAWIMAKRADRLGEFESGLDLLKSIQQPGLAALFCAASSSPDSAVNQFYQSVQLRAYSQGLK